MSPENHIPPHRPSCHSELCCWDPEATCSLEMRTAPSEEEPKKNWVLVWCAPLLLILQVKKQDSRQTVSIIHLIKVYNSSNGIATPFHNWKAMFLQLEDMSYVNSFFWNQCTSGTFERHNSINHLPCVCFDFFFKKKLIIKWNTYIWEKVLLYDDFWNFDGQMGLSVFL